VRLPRLGFDFNAADYDWTEATKSCASAQKGELMARNNEPVPDNGYQQPNLPRVPAPTPAPTRRK